VGPVRWVSNATNFFVPATPGAPVLKRLAVHTETCNGCHNPLSAHGGSRQEVQLCLTCHSQGAVDPETNNSIDFNVMIHKLHRGADLPSVKAGGHYGIVGYGNNTIDFSHVEYPRDLVHCQSCHSDTDDDRWVSNGTAVACTSCHDNIHEPGAHPFALAPTAVCGNGNCHGPGGSAPDARKAHVTFLNNPNAPVFDISIVSALVANADSAPQLTVRGQSGTRSSDGGVPVASVDNLSILNVFFNGPNRDFISNGHNIKTYNKASLVGLAPTANPGEFTFALPQTLREAAGTMGDVSKDSYTLSIRAQYDPTPGAPTGDAGVNDAVDMRLNPTVAISASGTAPVPRLPVSDTVKCNNCHGVLTGHGGAILAHNVEECIMCHTSTLETSVPQGANKEPGPTTSLRFPQLIHRIHATSIATKDYILYSLAPTPPYPHADFSDVEFPGDVKDCTTCHMNGTNLLPVKASPAPTQTLVLDAEGKAVQQ
jgi:OmcA/MtrC family decaheme c-type cytochrome